MIDPSKMTVAQLKEELDARGLSTTGEKEELKERLIEALDANEDEEEDPMLEAFDEAPGPDEDEEDAMGVRRGSSPGASTAAPAATPGACPPRAPSAITCPDAGAHAQRRVHGGAPIAVGVGTSVILQIEHQPISQPHRRHVNQV